MLLVPVLLPIHAVRAPAPDSRRTPSANIRHLRSIGVGPSWGARQRSFSYTTLVGEDAPEMRRYHADDQPFPHQASAAARPVPSGGQAGTGYFDGFGRGDGGDDGDLNSVATAFETKCTDAVMGREAADHLSRAASGRLDLDAAHPLPPPRSLGGRVRRLQFKARAGLGRVLEKTRSGWAHILVALFQLNRDNSSQMPALLLC